MKCQKCNIETKLYGTVTVLDASVIINTRCETCFNVYTYECSQPRQLDVNYEPPRLMPCSGNQDGRWEYFKCSRPSGDTYVLVAKRKLATRARLEELGYIVEDPTASTLPASRLYELV